MLTARGWSYSDSRRRRHRGARRVQPRRRVLTRAGWIVVPGVLVFVTAIGLALSAPLDQLVAEATPTPIVVALLPLPTSTPSAIPTIAPTATPIVYKPLLPSYRILAYYGNPLAGQMGILGELPPDQMLNKLTQQAAAYAPLSSPRPIMPALELVTPAAQGWPGEEGLYRARMKPEIIDEVAGWAEANHALLILDVQIGLSAVPEEVQALIPYLRRPYVHLALDPEFAIPSGHIPGEVVGSLDGSTIDGVIQTLSDLVRSEHLPPKILIVHRFTDDMVTNAWEIKPTSNVQVVITMDGFGPPGLKLAQYRAYVHDLGVQYAGIKLFYHHDQPLLTPADVLGLDPVPDLVIYQ